VIDQSLRLAKRAGVNNRHRIEKLITKIETILHRSLQRSVVRNELYVFCVCVSYVRIEKSKSDKATTEAKRSKPRSLTKLTKFNRDGNVSSIVEYEYLTSLVSDVFLTLTGIDIRL
jgi:hypothetical protein